MEHIGRSSRTAVGVQVKVREYELVPCCLLWLLMIGRTDVRTLLRARARCDTKVLGTKTTSFSGYNLQSVLCVMMMSTLTRKSEERRK